MPAVKETAPPPSPAFLDAFRHRANELGHGNTLSFADFMDLALYHPKLGYYRRDRPRVGRNAQADFYTATSSGPLFGELICAACVKLLGPQNDPHAFTFVEIGAEPGGGILRDVAHPFAATHTLRIGEPLDLRPFSRSASLSGSTSAHQTSPLIIFSNELFDAQPFRRFVARDGHWRELGVTLTADHQLNETELTGSTIGSSPISLPSDHSFPPSESREGYHLDLHLAAAALAAELAAQPWNGLFIACDYGKSWRELTEATPQGTARAYHRHQQSNDLLARPGEQDLTCHVCWDWLTDALARHGFSSPSVESQEAFLIHHAGDFIAQLTAAEATRLSARKLSLMQLLHPANLGQKFQVLHAFRA